MAKARSQNKVIITCAGEELKKNGLNIWSRLDAGCSYEVDVIAVQGFGAHPFYTWTRKIPSEAISTTQTERKRRLWPFSHPRGDGGDEDDKYVMWLRDLLPLELKNAQIATYSYESDWRDRTVNITLRECANQFLNIYFTIGGTISLGGLVIQQALVLASNREEFSSIRHSVTGIIFLGAPFRGSELAVYGEWIAKATEHSTKLLAILKKDNVTLHDLSGDFWAIYNKSDIVCFYESKDAEYGPWKHRVVDTQSSTIKGKRMMYMHTDHFGLSKFDGINDENYRLLLPEIRRMVTAAPSAMASLHDQLNQKGLLTVPFGQNKHFVGRKSILEWLLARIPPSAEENNCQRTAIEGLGGIGKTQIALEAAFQVHDGHPHCSIFWVAAVDVNTFEKSYRDIGRMLKVEKIDDPETDVKTVVKDALSKESAGSWLMVVDNADDTDLLFGNVVLSRYLPSSYKGSILFTTRDHRIAVDLSATPISVEKMERSESIILLEKGLPKDHLNSTVPTNKLLDYLEDLPLAIKQASAFIAKQKCSITEYLQLCQPTEEKLIPMLNQDFQDLHRYENIPNPVFQTFRISFEMISKHDPLAADYLRFISFLSEKDIPRSLLPLASDVETTMAIGTLKAYAFITAQKEEDTYNMHRLVRLSTLYWLASTGSRKVWFTKVLQRVSVALPWVSYKNEITWRKYVPHAQNLTNFLVYTDDIMAGQMLLRKLWGGLPHLGRYEKTEDMLRMLVCLGDEAQGESDRPNKLIDMHNLGWILYHKNQYFRAEMVLRDVHKKMQATNKIDHSTVGNMRIIAYLLILQAKFEESAEMSWQALKLAKEIWSRKHLDETHSDTPAASVDNNTALMFYQEAKSLHQQVVEIDPSLGSEIVFLMDDFAEMTLRQERYTEAERMYRQVLPLLEKVPDKDHWVVITAKTRLWLSVLGQGGRHEESYEILTEAVDAAKTVSRDPVDDTLILRGTSKLRFEKKQVWER